MADKKISALTAATTPLAGTEVLPIVQGGATVKVAVSDLTAGRNVSMADLTTTGNTILGNAQADTLNVGNGDIIKDASGNVGFGISPTQGVDIFKGITKFNNASYIGYVGTGTLGGAGGGGVAADFCVRSDTDLIFASGGPFTRMRIPAATGDITAVVGNFVVGTSGKGIDFSATPGTGTSELLADYEEGAYVATLTPETSGTIPLNDNFNTLSYTKVGRVVTVQGQIQTFNPVLPVGANFALNLPFTPVDLPELAGRGGTVINYQFTAVTATWEEGTANLYIIKNASTVANAENLFLSFSYFAA
jgi:hypothetical protein